MERGFDGERRRRFDAHELYLLSVVFDVPIAYFFIPPPGTGIGELADTHRPVAELYAQRCSARTTQLDAVDARLAEIKIDNPEAADEVLAAIFGARGRSPELARAFPHVAQEAGSARSRSSTATSSTRSPSSSPSSPTKVKALGPPATCDVDLASLAGETRRDLERPEA